MTSNEDTPWGVAPPHWSRLGDPDDVVQLHWQAPAKPHGKLRQHRTHTHTNTHLCFLIGLFPVPPGDISHYVVLRDGQERYRGDERSFTDVGGIRPFQEYGYWLRACNTAGCTDSSQVGRLTSKL